MSPGPLLTAFNLRPGHLVRQPDDHTEVVRAVETGTLLVAIVTTAIKKKIVIVDEATGTTVTNLVELAVPTTVTAIETVVAPLTVIENVVAGMIVMATVIRTKTVTVIGIATVTARGETGTETTTVIAVGAN